jgi:hypothetical protein
MRRGTRFILTILFSSVIAACTLPGAASPTPFTYPTPNLTHTAVFAATPSQTPIPPTLPPLGSPTQQDLTTPTPPSATLSTDAIPTPSVVPSATSVVLSSRPNGDPVTAAYLDAPPVIDGELNEWATTPYVANETAPRAAENWTGANDLSATFYLGWDAENLYVAIRRTDDVFVQISWGRYMYRGDDVEIQLDADLAGDFYTTTMSPDDFQIGLSPGNFDSLTPEAYRWHPRYLESWLNNVDVAAVKAGEGYALEVAIPWSVFNVTPSSGSRFGFALSLSDNDIAGKSTWQSMVTNVNTRTTVDPTTWGTLILGAP